MTDEINPSELGAFTNNLPNKEGIKKLVSSLEGKQEKLTAGSNIAISDENVISATDTKYTAGDNVQISDQNVISATDTKYTAGTGITISDENVISASGGASWVACETTDLKTEIQSDYATHEFLIISDEYVGIFNTNSISNGTYYVEPVKTKLSVNTNSTVNNYITQLGVKISGSSASLVYGRLIYDGSGSYPLSATGYDFINDINVDATNIDQYISYDTTTGKATVLKTFAINSSIEDTVRAILYKGDSNVSRNISYITYKATGNNIISLPRFELSDIYKRIKGINTSILSSAHNIEVDAINTSTTITKIYKRPKTNPLS